jgi:hypothetical protein
MRASTRKSISLLMLIISVVMSLGAYGFNSKWLAHELDHDQQALPTLADHDHSLAQVAQGNDLDPEPLSATDHQLLHASEHLQTPLIGSHFDRFKGPSAQMGPPPPPLLAPSQVELGRLFRPPRSARI